MIHLERLAKAARRGVRVAAAESLTSGLLCSAVGSAEKASDWFVGGVVTYFTEAKERLLGLPPGLDPYSAASAVRLALGARDLFLADVAVATTGVGGPEPDGGHPAGTVYLGWATGFASGHRELRLGGSPETVLRGCVEHAVALLADLVEHEAERGAGDQS